MAKGRPKRSRRAARRREAEANIQAVSVGGKNLVIMEEDEYERLLDAIDAAEARRIAEDRSDPVLTWDDIKDEFVKNRIAEVRGALAGLEAEGVVFQGSFVREGPTSRWCERTILEWMHRLTLARLRRDIEPVPQERWIEFLLTWQHLAPHARLHGLEGLQMVIEKLQGVELPATAWEQEGGSWPSDW